jgi:hypothetical protein
MARWFGALLLVVAASGCSGAKPRAIDTRVETERGSGIDSDDSPQTGGGGDRAEPDVAAAIAIPCCATAPEPVAEASSAETIELAAAPEWVLEMAAAAASEPETVPSTAGADAPGPPVAPRVPAAELPLAEEVDGPTWNVAFRQGKVPVARLAPREDYTFVVRLGTEPPGKGSLDVPPKQTLHAELRRAEQDHRETVTLTVYVLFDAAHFEPGGGARKLVVDLRAYEQWLASKDREVILGEVRFPIRTRAAPTEDARIAVLVWRDGVPIDEMALGVCIGRAGARCEAVRLLPTGDDPDPVRPIAAGVVQPLASLHVVELRAGESSSMVGLFKERGYKAVRWELGASAEELNHHLSRTLVRAFGGAAAADSERGLLEDGWALFKLVFPWNPDDDDQKRANATFADFVRRHKDDAEKPALFVRVVTARGLALDLPVGLMAIKDRPGAPPEPIGFSFRVESPLRHQEYDRTDCPKKWRLLLPLPDKEYGDAGALSSAAATAKLAPDALPWASASFAPEWDFEKFRAWLEAEEEDDETLLLILSHHADNAIWFDRGRPLVSLTMNRSFRKPSVAILNGCGTMEPGAAAIVDALNRRGAAAVIATATSVGGKMAGEYVRCFVERMKKAPQEGVPLSFVHLDAVTCVRDAAGDDGPYGARALVFGMLGNGSVRVCPPEDP